MTGIMLVAWRVADNVKVDVNADPTPVSAVGRAIETGLVAALHDAAER